MELCLSGPQIIWNPELNEKNYGKQTSIPEVKQWHHFEEKKIEF